MDASINRNVITDKTDKLTMIALENVEVSAFINVHCSLHELMSIFFTTDDVLYQANTKELYGSAFNHGYLTTWGRDQRSDQKGFFGSSIWNYIKRYNTTNSGAVVKILSLEQYDKQGAIAGVQAMYMINSTNRPSEFHKLRFNVMFKVAAAVHNKKYNAHILMLAKGLAALLTVITNRRIIIQHFIDATECP